MMMLNDMFPLFISVMPFFKNNMIWGSFFYASIVLSVSYWKIIVEHGKDFMFNIRNHNMIELHGTVLEDRNEITTKFSNKLKALIHYINMNCIYDKKLKKLMEISYCNYYCFDNKLLETEYLINQNIPFQLTDDIYCKIHIDYQDLHNDKRIVKMKEIEICVYSELKTVSEIKEFLKNTENEYDQFIEHNMNCNSYCFIYNKMDDLGRPIFIRNKFESTKTFDNLIFRDKHLLKDRLDFFLNKKEFYNSLGIPYTLGLLFYGYPGTGKTSTIKAIANYTKRHIIIIPMTKIHNISTLRDIILNEELGDFKIPQNKRLYVFEEIDCNGMEKIIKTRVEGEEVVSSTSAENIKKLEEKLKSITEVYPKNNPVNDDKVTLGGFLELLDGINEASGRIMIMTTNSDPAKFDEAFQRPGRIDCKIQFQKCNRNEIEQLYRMWFEESIPKEKIKEIGENIFTPAELGELFIRYIETPDKILEHLIYETKNKLEYNHVF
jgi:DNA replication protein DnaC